MLLQHQVSDADGTGDRPTSRPGPSSVVRRNLPDPEQADVGTLKSRSQGQGDGALVLLDAAEIINRRIGLLDQETGHDAAVGA